MSSDRLSIEAIFVPGFGEPVHAETYLQALSETEWTELRAEATRSRRSGNPVLLCGDCRGSVYGRESTAGRRHCYHFGTDVKDCRWATANAANFRSIDASKFKGNQEGERHKALKAMICEILSFDVDAADAGIIPERYTKGTDGEYAFPDVFASSWQGAKQLLKFSWQRHNCQPSPVAKIFMCKTKSGCVGSSPAMSVS
ncbi:hypothetical protein ACFQDZ_21200 [Sulfitobacter pacificus]|uniref:hypothetical protein n=1 Tax=Sulfitobacter pacificus TaxID=1499314 RepID=UPI00361DF549